MLPFLIGERVQLLVGQVDVRPRSPPSQRSASSELRETRLPCCSSSSTYRRPACARTRRSRSSGCAGTASTRTETTPSASPRTATTPHLPVTLRPLLRVIPGQDRTGQDKAGVTEPLENAEQVSLWPVAVPGGNVPEVGQEQNSLKTQQRETYCRRGGYANRPLPGIDLCTEHRSDREAAEAARERELREAS